MSQQQVQQRPSAANGVGRRRNDRDVANRPDATFRSDSQNWRSTQASRPATTSVSPSPVIGHTHGQHHPSNSLAPNIRSAGERDGTSVGSGRSGGNEADPHRMALMHYCNCLIGQHVDVQMKNGRVYTGIYHTALIPNHGGEFGVVLKYARMTKDAPLKAGKSTAVRDAARKPPLKILNVHSEEFVQIIAKDVTIFGDAIANGRLRDNKSELLTDSSLAAGKQKELERELKPWQPDEEAPRNLALDTTFQSTWNRNWDQFETNKALFGVESTFNEELYTTKLERGSHMREREREAQRIAKEIETTSTRNLHLAEERGVRLTPELESLDEEARFSSVLRGNENRDVGEDDEDGDIDGHNQDTFGGGASPSDSTVSTPVAPDPESRGSGPASAESKTTSGPAKRDPSGPLRDRRTTSIEKGEMAALDSLADTHREHWRLRHILVGDNRKRSNKGPGSPYHSGRASPLHSPLVGDPATIQALNLDPSCPNVPEEVFRSDGDLDSRREFHEFKLETAKKGSKKQREDQVNELKSFSESFKERTKKDVEPRSPRTQGKQSGDTTSSGNRHASHEGGSGPSSSGDIKSSLGPSVTTSATMLATPIQPSQGGGSEASTSSHAGTGVATVTSRVKVVGSASANAVSVDLTGSPAGSGVSGVVPAGGVSVSHQQSPAVSSGGHVSSSSVLAAGLFSSAQSVPAPISIPSSSSSTMGSSMISPASAASSATSGSGAAASKSTLKKEFKLNPNAKSFTPSFPRPASPMISSQVYLQTGLPPVSPLPAMPVGVNLNQYLQQQPGQPTQYTQYGNGLGGATVSSAPYLQQPPGAYVPAAGGPPVLPGQPSIKISPQSQQQLQVVGPPYAQQQVLRYPPQGPPLQAPAYMQPHGQLYPQQMMYSQPGLVYVPYPQGMIQGQPIQGQPVPPQGPLPQQPPAQQSQQQKHRGGGGGGMQGMHYAGAPPFLPSQQHHIQQSQMSHLHNSLQPTQGGMGPTSLTAGAQVSQGVSTVGPSVQSGGTSGVGNGGRGGGKGGVGNFQQQ